MVVLEGNLMGESNLRPRRPPRRYLGEYTSRGKPKIPSVDLAYEKKKEKKKVI